MTYLVEGIDVVRVALLGFALFAGFWMLKHLVASRLGQQPIRLPVDPLMPSGSSQRDHGTTHKGADRQGGESQRRFDARPLRRRVAAVATGFAVMMNVFIWSGDDTPPLAGIIGMGLLVYSGYLLLRLRNPNVTVVLGGDPPAAGSSFRIDYRLSGDARRISTLTIDLVSREVATYGSGTSKVTRVAETWRLPLLSTNSAASMATGTLVASVPGDAMPSFKATYNAIVWRLEFRGAIAKGPDLTDDFEIHLALAT